jgi:hypothetical protein
MIFTLGSSLVFRIAAYLKILQMWNFSVFERWKSLARYRCVSPRLLPALLPSIPTPEPA